MPWQRGGGFIVQRGYVHKATHKQGIFPGSQRGGWGDISGMLLFYSNDTRTPAAVGRGVFVQALHVQHRDA